MCVCMSFAHLKLLFWIFLCYFVIIQIAVMVLLCEEKNWTIRQTFLFPVLWFDSSDSSLCSYLVYCPDTSLNFAHIHAMGASKTRIAHLSAAYSKKSNVACMWKKKSFMPLIVSQMLSTSRTWSKHRLFSSWFYDWVNPHIENEMSFSSKTK